MWGYAYAGPFRARPAYQWTTEATVYVHPDHQGKGWAGPSTRRFSPPFAPRTIETSWGASPFRIPRAWPCTRAWDSGRRGAILAAGFKLGGWHDVGFWQIQLRGDAPPAGPPRVLALLLGTPEWEAALDAGAALLSRP